MKTVGIVAEYNPFHNGHLYQMEQAKKITGADFVVVVMSGDFVQRGTPAIYDKYIRTQTALLAGADLVLELPVRYAVSSAELFAEGAVKLLNSLGIIDTICFGSECGNIHFLQGICKILLEETQEYRTLLKQHLGCGLSYPVSRAKALLNILPESQRQEAEHLLIQSNNILGIEYCKAILKYKLPIIPFTLKRKGAEYNDPTFFEKAEQYSSATAIREIIKNTANLSASSYYKKLALQLPESIIEFIKVQKKMETPVFSNDFSEILYYRLLQENQKTLSDYLDVTQDLANRMSNYLTHSFTFDKFAAALKTKQITLTRIQRVLIHVLLGISKDSIFSSRADSTLPYIRVLGVQKNSTFLLKKCQQHQKTKYIIKPAHAKKLLPPLEFGLFEQDIFASRLYQQIVFRKSGLNSPDEEKQHLLLN